ncbi:SPOR domain-containing protein [Shewanella sp. JM162201]|uniref:SPOR domain-containing protein n=1 Tax=Shewanella jiangmenensis TaxID=2837387 RepID=A0ABS5V7F5_9GAMM|nr:SPOR domain-containing protein [Shewanella jiangmenensis]
MKVESLESLELASSNGAAGTSGAAIDEPVPSGDDGAFLLDEPQQDEGQDDAALNDAAPAAAAVTAQKAAESLNESKADTKTQSNSDAKPDVKSDTDAAEAAADAKKAAEAKALEKKAADAKAAEKKAAELKAAEKKAAEKKAAELKAAELKAAELKAAELKAAEAKAAERKPQPYQPQIQPYQPDGPVAQKPAVKAVESKPTASAAKGGWTLQLGAFSNAANVDALVKKLRKSGFKAYTVPSRPVDGSLTKVYVGPDVSEAKLRQVAADVESLTQLKGKLMPYNPLE